MQTSSRFTNGMKVTTCRVNLFATEVLLSHYRLYTFVEAKNYMIALHPDHSQSPVFDTLHCAKMEREGLRDLIMYSDIET